MGDGRAARYVHEFDEGSREMRDIMFDDAAQAAFRDPGGSWGEGAGG